jgi:hypothetical protein
MLERHLFGTPAKIGVGANRAAIAACCFERYGYIDPRSSCDHKLCLDKNVESQLNSEKIGAVILDDGMQVLKLCSLFSFCCWNAIFIYILAFLWQVSIAELFI